MDRYWLLTSTFYGNWLPGDPRGFVSRVRNRRPEDLLALDARGADATPLAARREHDVPGTPYDHDLRGLHRHAQEQLKGKPVHLNHEQAQVLLAQFLETADYRGWRLWAVAIMFNHVHLVVGVPGDPDPTKVLGDFKSYGSRVLTARWAKPESDTWWTYAGSKRKLPNEAAVLSAIEYVRNQHNPLVVWISPELSAR